ncbi:hypothetical protein [Jeotgalibaca porci]|uniref:hypothetical protein n=1 Tax=Jeotgalibaca porci TaxID=1868793 RepID=UPI00359F4B40
MKYKTIVIGYSPKAKSMAAAVEVKANEMASQGYELVTMSITNSKKQYWFSKQTRLPRPKLIPRIQLRNRLTIWQTQVY